MTEQDPVSQLIGPGANQVPPIAKIPVLLDYLGGQYECMPPVQDKH